MDSRSNGPVNPFKMPTDEEVFILRDEEKRQKALEREALKYKSVHEKTTWSARIGSAKLKTTVEGGYDSSEGLAATTSPAATGAEVTLPGVEKRVKDNMSRYIAKKRKMGLARMSLATKRQEIKKLDEEAERAEKRITQMEEQLKETEGKFRDFLRHSEMEQVEAFKKAENETKAKQDKLTEIKKLSAQISQIETDKRKNEDQLAQCLEFKGFLDLLTPTNFFLEQLTRIKQEDARGHIAARLEHQFNEETANAEGLTEQEEAERHDEMLAQLEEQAAAASDRIADEMASLPPDTDDTREFVMKELDAVDPDRVPMYFTNPDQILQKFIEIEEGNLFLITTCQEYEEQIEDIAQKYKLEQQEMVELAEQRRGQMETISKNIQAEQGKMKALQERIDRAGDSGTGPTQDELRERITEKIKSIYKTLGLGDDTNVGTLGSLTQIEVKLEDMRQQIQSSSMEQAFVTQVMKQRDKDRRRDAREVLLTKQREERERRSKLALKRSEAPVKKRVGKPVMWRSRPNDHKKQEQTGPVETAGNDDDEFFQ